MQDRTPTPGQEGRALITPEDGSPSYYAKITMADNPTQEGTPYDKQNVLQDVTCDAIGIPHTSTPNEAFLALALGVGQYGYAISVVFPDGSPVEGATLTEVNAPDGGTATTDENGFAFGVSSYPSITFSVISPFVDIENASGITIQSTGILTSYTVTLNAKDYALITSSGIFKYSPAVLIYDLCAIGAGGGGASKSGTSTGAGSGGGGGYAVNTLNLTPTAEREIRVSIGAGGLYLYGNDGQSAGTGGSTTVKNEGGDTLIAASGGNAGTVNDGTSIDTPGGAGNGAGGASNDGVYRVTMNGTDANVYLFGDPLLGYPGGGGGGGGNHFGASSVAPAGGAPNGANGAYANAGVAINATTPGIGGGGGGGATYNGQNIGAPSSGGNGAVYFRGHYTWEDAT